MTAVWMVPHCALTAHAFDRAELATLPQVSALRWCGTWPVAELEENELAERCRLCQRAVDELERSSP
ncbi:MAG TPA: hypothetical protein VGX25_00545 [Actinophytocola sp.]|uniref:hypothetical protein n=1 Tax=Actinophytocola sp. TaxID=1872138 RepID=UPI002DDD6FF2|nr:hypothetical protein [Actinophytocola sp.]HEV2777867.1 hypothetical protein [Actinophytocola sp.]